LKKNGSYFSITLLVLVLSLLIGGILSLIIGLRYDEFIWISPYITILDSISLGIAVLLSLYFTRYLAARSKSAILMLLLSFGLMLGAGMITFITFFFLNPTAFFYSDNRTVTYLLINLLFFISINIITSGFVIFQQTVLEKEKALNEEKGLKTQMELKLLASKINPHFLFNSLNLMVSLLSQPDKAETALINLSEILRYQLDFSDAQTVSLGSELSVVEKYLSIQQMRFGEKLTYQVDCHTEAQIPPMIIQPLVENCIKHNIDFTEHLHIDLKITNENGQVVITILDSQAILNPAMLDKGVGLTVTRRRVEYLGGIFLIKNGGIEISFKS
jgi:two-component system, LytTR family, sensor kinase